MATYLDKILAHHRNAAAHDQRSLEALIDEARDAGPVRGFRSALASAERLAVIAEVKRRSPSKGALRPDLDPAALAEAYRTGGASCVSVLTDSEFFGGSIADLQAARTCGLPVLRKDFTVSAKDVCDARIIGADAVLLIAAALDNTELRDFHVLALELGLDPLIEVHDEKELARVVDHIPAPPMGWLIGVNQRDLVTFQVDHERAQRMAATIAEATADSVVTVAESGVRGADDAAALRSAGYDAVLVGETLVTAPDPADGVASLICR